MIVRKRRVFRIGYCWRLQMATKVKTIRTNADFIETTLNDVKTTVEQRIADIMKLLV